MGARAPRRDDQGGEGSAPAGAPAPHVDDDHENDFGSKALIVGTDSAALRQAAKLIGFLPVVHADPVRAREYFMQEFPQVVLLLVMAFAVLPVQATVWTSAVASRFAVSRGMALAVTLCGASLAQFLFPLLALMWGRRLLFRSQRGTGRSSLESAFYLLEWRLLLVVGLAFLAGLA